MPMKLKNYILNYLREEEIFAHYLNVDIAIIKECIQHPSDKISNPLRDDKHPSVGFKYITGNRGDSKLIAKDFANTFYCGDIFHWVGLIIHEDCNNPKGFIKICYHIINTLLRDKRELLLSKNQTVDVSIIEYDIVDRAWNKVDNRYWAQYNLDFFDVTEAPTILVRKLYVDDKLVYTYKHEDPCYGYVSGHPNGDRYKFYFPFRKRPDVRFITNIKTVIEYPMELVKGEKLLLTKSRKDVLVLRKLLKDANLNIVVNCLTSESIRLRHEHLSALNNIYKDIYLFMDNDAEGIRCMQYHKYAGIKPIFLPRSIAKDISDHVSKYKYLPTLNTVKHYAKTIIE